MTQDDRTAKLEVRVGAVESDIAEMKADLRDVRDTIVGARMGWKLLLGAAATAGGAAGWLAQYMRSTGRG
jgi:hypothetical protein